MKTDLEKNLAYVLNIFSQENESNTPDFILANYLIGCLKIFNETTNSREEWYSRRQKEVDDETQIL